MFVIPRIAPGHKIEFQADLPLGFCPTTKNLYVQQLDVVNLSLLLRIWARKRCLGMQRLLKCQFSSLDLVNEFRHFLGKGCIKCTAKMV